MKQVTTSLALTLLIGSVVAQTRTLEAAASLQPKTPGTGEHRLEIVFTDGGKPKAGLQFTSSVAMTNMDMGTAHPVVKEVSPGHYVVRPMLLMNGPWRVTLTSTIPKFSLKWDIEAGAKQPWAAAKQTVAIPGGADIPQPEHAKADFPKEPQPKTDPMQGHKMPEPQTQNALGYSNHSGHKGLSMLQLKEKTAYAWTEDMDFDTRTGFGRLEPMVRMMILMMVGGSGMEGMRMPPMKMDFNEANFLESKEGGEMPGMTMAAKPFKVEAKLDKALVGDNTVLVTVLTPDGTPVEKAKITTSIAMTSMDMGTTHPAVKELGKGKYSVKANFSMAGPWRITLTIALSSQSPSTYTFDFGAQ